MTFVRTKAHTAPYTSKSGFHSSSFVWTHSTIVAPSLLFSSSFDNIHWLMTRWTNQRQGNSWWSTCFLSAGKIATKRPHQAWCELFLIKQWRGLFFHWTTVPHLVTDSIHNKGIYSANVKKVQKNADPPPPRLAIDCVRLLQLVMSVNCSHVGIVIFYYWWGRYIFFTEPSFCFLPTVSWPFEECTLEMNDTSLVSFHMVTVIPSLDAVW